MIWARSVHRRMITLYVGAQKLANDDESVSFERRSVVRVVHSDRRAVGARDVAEPGELSGARGGPAAGLGREPTVG